MITDCSQSTIFLYFLFITMPGYKRTGCQCKTGDLIQQGVGTEKNRAKQKIEEKSEFLVSPEMENSHWL